MPKKKSTPKTNETPCKCPLDPINAAVNHLVDVCGFKGESGTEEFYHLLFEVLHEIDGVIEQSHQEGLCIDMASVIAHELNDRVTERNEAEKARWN